MLRNHILMATVLVFACANTCFAAPTQPGGKSQPGKPQANSDMSRLETKMQSKLQSVSESGKIDDEAMQAYQDRFNELRAKEEELRAQGAMTSKAVKDLQNGLDELERDLDKDVKEKAQEAKSQPGSYSKTQDTSGPGSSYAQSGDTSGQSSSYAKSTDE